MASQPNDRQSRFGRLLRLLRLREGVTQVQLATRSTLSLDCVKSLEEGRRDCGRSTCELLIFALGLEPREARLLRRAAASGRSSRHAVTSPAHLAGGLGLRLRTLRRSRGLSQLELGRLSSFSPGYLQKIESGERRCPVATVAALACALRLDQDEHQALLEAAVDRDQSTGVCRTRLSTRWTAATSGCLDQPSQHVRENAAMTVVLDLDGAVDSNQRLELDCLTRRSSRFDRNRLTRSKRV